MIFVDRYPSQEDLGKMTDENQKYGAPDNLNTPHKIRSWMEKTRDVADQEYSVREAKTFVEDYNNLIKAAQGKKDGLDILARYRNYVQALKRSGDTEISETEVSKALNRLESEIEYQTVKSELDTLVQENDLSIITDPEALEARGFKQSQIHRYTLEALRHSQQPRANQPEVPQTSMAAAEPRPETATASTASSKEALPGLTPEGTVSMNDLEALLEATNNNDGLENVPVITEEIGNGPSITESAQPATGSEAQSTNGSSAPTETTASSQPPAVETTAEPGSRSIPEFMRKRQERNQIAGEPAAVIAEAGGASSTTEPSTTEPASLNPDTEVPWHNANVLRNTFGTPVAASEPTTNQPEPSPIIGRRSAVGPSHSVTRDVPDESRSDVPTMPPSHAVTREVPGQLPLAKKTSIFGDAFIDDESDATPFDFDDEPLPPTINLAERSAREDFPDEFDEVPEDPVSPNAASTAESEQSRNQRLSGLGRVAGETSKQAARRLVGAASTLRSRIQERNTARSSAKAARPDVNVPDTEDLDEILDQLPDADDQPVENPTLDLNWLNDNSRPLGQTRQERRRQSEQKAGDAAFQRPPTEPAPPRPGSLRGQAANARNESTGSSPAGKTEAGVTPGAKSAEELNKLPPNERQALLASFFGVTPRSTNRDTTDDARNIMNTVRRTSREQLLAALKNMPTEMSSVLADPNQLAITQAYLKVTGQ